jgi:hypothetical protein
MASISLLLSVSRAPSLPVAALEPGLPPRPLPGLLSMQCNTPPPQPPPPPPPSIPSPKLRAPAPDLLVRGVDISKLWRFVGVSLPCNLRVLGFSGVGVDWTCRGTVAFGGVCVVMGEKVVEVVAQVVRGGQMYCVQRQHCCGANGL